MFHCNNLFVNSFLHANADILNFCIFRGDAILELLKLAVLIEQKAHVTLLDAQKTGNFIFYSLALTLDMLKLIVHLLQLLILGLLELEDAFFNFITHDYRALNSAS